jgi:hypothetical protein
MSRRIDVELTSSREDGTWTWRAAGAKQPKGELDGALLYPDAKVGDVVRADADFLLDGIVITAVLPPKAARKEPDRLEVLGPPRRDDQLVTTQLAPKGRGRREGDRRPRREGERDGRPRNDRDRRPRREGDRPGGERRERRARPAPGPVPERPKPKRLRAGRTHRNAVLAGLPEEQKPVAEQVLRGGIPAVRQAVEKQNETNKGEGLPEINPAPLLALAEQLTPALRAAEWRDRAEAALADLSELDLRDLRSVVVAADAAARDEETRELAEKLRAGLAERVDAEHAAWLEELEQTLAAGRVVRALRVSSRPPKAGAPFPAELASRLAADTAASLTADTGSDRYATVLDALAYSPVRGQVTPEAVPAEPSEELLAAVRKLASRLPQIAALFGIEAPSSPSRSARGKGRGKGRTAKPIPPPPATPAQGAPATTAAEPATDAPRETSSGGGEAPSALAPGEQPAGSLEAGDEPAGSLEAGDEPAGALEPSSEPAAGEAAQAPRSDDPSAGGTPPSTPGPETDEDPSTEAPSAETSEVHTPETETSEAGTPVPEAPEVQTPETETSEAETSPGADEG